MCMYMCMCACTEQSRIDVVSAQVHRIIVFRNIYIQIDRCANLMEAHDSYLLSFFFFLLLLYLISNKSSDRWIRDEYYQGGGVSSCSVQICGKLTTTNDQTNLQAAASPAFSCLPGPLRGPCPRPSCYRTRIRGPANRPTRCYFRSSRFRCFPGQWSLELFARQHSRLNQKGRVPA